MLAIGSMVRRKMMQKKGRVNICTLPWLTSWSDLSVSLSLSPLPIPIILRPVCIFNFAFLIY